MAAMEVILLKESEYIDYLLEDGPGGAAAAGSIGIGAGGVGYSNANTGGMGQVTSANPSSSIGVTTEPGYSAGGGTIGSGDISIPYNPGGRKKMFQKVESSRRGTNKRRNSRMISKLKGSVSKSDYTHNQGNIKPNKIMNFDSFSKDELSNVTHVKQ